MRIYRGEAVCYGRQDRNNDESIVPCPRSVIDPNTFIYSGHFNFLCCSFIHDPPIISLFFPFMEIYYDYYYYYSLSTKEKEKKS